MRTNAPTFSDNRPTFRDYCPASILSVWELWWGQSSCQIPDTSLVSGITLQQTQRFYWVYSQPDIVSVSSPAGSDGSRRVVLWMMSCQDCITGSSCLCKSGVRIPNVTETSLHCRMLGVTAPWDWRRRKCCCSYKSRCCTWTNVSPATRTHPQPPRATQPGVHTGKLRHNKWCSKKYISSKLLLFISDISLKRQKIHFYLSFSTVMRHCAGSVFTKLKSRIIFQHFSLFASYLNLQEVESLYQKPEARPASSDSDCWWHVFCLLWACSLLVTNNVYCCLFTLRPQRDQRIVCLSVPGASQTSKIKH